MDTAVGVLFFGEKGLRSIGHGVWRAFFQKKRIGWTEDAKKRPVGAKNGT